MGNILEGLSVPAPSDWMFSLNLPLSGKEEWLEPGASLS